MLEAVNTSETSVSFYQTARRNIPENNHLRHKFILGVWKQRYNELDMAVLE
jgi:hypothetical protein